MLTNADRELKLKEFYSDWSVAKHGKASIDIITDAIHASERGSKVLVLNPADDTALPFIIMVNRSADSTGPLLYAGVPVELDHGVQVGSFALNDRI